MALVEVTKKNNIAVITMNRPEALNALNKAVFAEFEAALDDVEKDNDVYVVIITGAGRAFIAGADIGEMAPMNVAEGLAFSELGNRILLLSPHPGRVRAEIHSHQYDLHSLGGVAFQASARRIHRLLFDESPEAETELDFADIRIAY